MTYDDWTYQPSESLDENFVERLKRFPREPDMTVYIARTATALIIRSWLKAYHRLSIQGTEHVPDSGSFVVVANHTSHLDTLMILSAFGKRRLHRVFPAAAADYFFSSIPRSVFTGIVINALPFDRKKNSAESLEVCRHLLANGDNILVIFPEGTRTATGETGTFKSGVARLVAGTAIPVVPCWIEGGFAAWPRGAWLPRPRRVTLAFGEPVTFSKTTPDREGWRSVCNTLRAAVVGLKQPAHARAKQSSINDS